jgi:hypothetical protein
VGAEDPLGQYAPAGQGSDVLVVVHRLPAAQSTLATPPSGQNWPRLHSACDDELAQKYPALQRAGCTELGAQ